MRYACLIYYDPKALFGGSPEANSVLVIESVLGQGGLDDYHLAHAARASYQRALELTHQSAERRFLQARLTELAGEHTRFWEPSVWRR